MLRPQLAFVFAAADKTSLELTNFAIEFPTMPPPFDVTARRNPQVSKAPHLLQNILMTFLILMRITRRRSAFSFDDAFSIFSCLFFSYLFFSYISYCWRNHVSLISFYAFSSSISLAFCLPSTWPAIYSQIQTQSEETSRVEP